MTNVGGPVTGTTPTTCRVCMPGISNLPTAWPMRGCTNFMSQEQSPGWAGCTW